VTPQDERFLVEQARNGSQAAFTVLYDANVGIIRNTGYKILRFHPADADDYTQEVFLRGFTRLNSYRGDDCTFRTWLVAIARNFAVDTLMQRQRQAYRFPSINRVAEDGSPSRRIITIKEGSVRRSRLNW
jgi:RNA polymerase sigma factor (sigma-70 family)